MLGFVSNKKTNIEQESKPCEENRSFQISKLTLGEFNLFTAGMSVVSAEINRGPTYRNVQFAGNFECCTRNCASSERNYVGWAEYIVNPARNYLVSAENYVGSTRNSVQNTKNLLNFRQLEPARLELAGMSQR